MSKQVVVLVNRGAIRSLIYLFKEINIYNSKNLRFSHVYSESTKHKLVNCLLFLLLFREVTA